jgi:hypothetical protein
MHAQKSHALLLTKKNADIHGSKTPLIMDRLLDSSIHRYSSRLHSSSSHLRKIPKFFFLLFHYNLHYFNGMPLEAQPSHGLFPLIIFSKRQNGMKQNIVCLLRIYKIV